MVPMQPDEISWCFLLTLLNALAENLENILLISDPTLKIPSEGKNHMEKGCNRGKKKVKLCEWKYRWEGVIGVWQATV